MTRCQMFILSSAASVREFPSLMARTLTTLYKNDVISVTGKEEVYYDRTVGDVVFNEVEYRPSKFGWIYSGLLSAYVQESYPVVHIPDNIKTPERDAEQYILWDGMKKTNLCGAFCVAHLAGIAIDEFLSKWKIYSPSNYASNISQNKPVGISVVRMMVSMCELEQLHFGKFFDDKLTGEFYSIQGFIKGLESGWRAVLGVKIGYDGKLNTGTIGHWVVLTDVSPIRNGDGIVSIYNPHSNRIQKYSYAEMIKSMTSFGGYVGLWVKPKGTEMKSTIVEFCDRKRIKKDMMDAFIAYVRSSNASKYMMRPDGDTVRLIVEKMTEEQVQAAWVQFISDFRQVLPSVV